MLVAVPIPPHFRYYCHGCSQDFGTAERAAWQEKGQWLKPMWCEKCAFVENRRIAE